MRGFYKGVAALAALSVSTSAIASPKWDIQPVQHGQETVRYLKSVPTLDLEQHDGVVQITPLPFDHGSLVFGVAVYNDGHLPANMGIEQVHVSFGGQPVTVFTEHQLVKKAKSRAMWSQIGLAVLGGLAAGAASSQRYHYNSTFITPRGTYRYHFSAPSVAGQFQAAAITASTGYGIAQVQSQLDQTIAVLGDEVIQLTTVDPGESYAGKFVIAKVDPKALPATVNITIDWNGESYPFVFRIAKRGSPAPVFTALTGASDLTSFGEPATPRLTPAVMQQAASQRPAESQSAVLLQTAQIAPEGGAPNHGLNSNSHVTCVTCRR